MLRRKILRLLRRLTGRAHTPRMSLDEWIAYHWDQVAEDVAGVIEHIPEGGRFVDVGCNVGLFTACILQQRAGCRADLFEPVKEYYEHCRARFADNPLVRVHPFAVGPEAGPATIFKADHNYGGNTLMKEFIDDDRSNAHFTQKTTFGTEEIELVNFSDFAREHDIGDVDFVKTDAEGYDFAVLRSMLPWLAERSYLPVIFAEMLSPEFHLRAQEQEEVVRDLVALGYHDVELPLQPKVYDVLFLPLERPAG